MKIHAATPNRLLIVLIALLFMLSTGLTSGRAQEATEPPTPPPTEAVPTATPVTPAPTLPPEQTVEPSPEATTPPEQTTEPSPEATTPPEQTAEPSPEATTPPEVTDAPTPEATAETTPVSPFEVAAICLETGPAFVITNHGPDMTEPAFYTLIGAEPVVIAPTPDAPVDEPVEQPTDVPTDVPAEPPVEQPTDVPAEPPVEQPTDVPTDVPADTPVAESTPEPEADAPEGVEASFQLAAGESLTVSGGTSLRLGEDVYAADPACVIPPVLTVSAVCVFETGAAFTVENSGGPMKAEMSYSIATTEEPIEGVYLLGANQSVTFEAGFGEPVFTSGEVTRALEAPCYAPVVISGVIWDDLDGDGLRAETEPGLANMTVELADPAGFALTAVTAEDGTYLFELLPSATYVVRVDLATLPAGYTLTAPAGASEPAVTLETLMGLTYTADFGFTSLPTASISGALWLETGNFGVREATELGIAGAMVELVDETGAVIATVPADAVTGAYRFGELFDGTYTVRLVQASLFTPIGITWDLDGDHNFETTVILEAGQALSGVDFGIAGTF